MLPYLNDGNIVQGVVLTFSGITEIKRVERALEAAKSEAERANLGKSRFLAAASHDLRQPLQTISLLQGILAKRVHDEPTLKIVQRLDETVDVMSSMLDKLLDINQLEAGIVKAEIVEFPIARLFDSLKTEFSYHATTSELVWRVVGSSASVRSDPQLLEQIIRNLLSNAMKYTPKGKILLGCRRRGDSLRIEVWDTGIGIPESELKAIFDEFHQLDNPARELSKGLGLGLTIVQRLADLLGHGVDVHSRKGIGSVFSVEVPLARKCAEQLATPAATSTLGPAVNGTILVIEDNPDVLEMLHMALADAGHQTITAIDGHRALVLAAHSLLAFDVVITDYNLPNGLDGLETLSRLQAQAGHSIAAVVLTGDISTNSLRKVVSSGFEHMSKPVRSAELGAMVQKLLKLRELRRGAEGTARLAKSRRRSIVDRLCDRRRRHHQGEYAANYWLRQVTACSFSRTVRHFLTPNICNLAASLSTH